MSGPADCICTPGDACLGVPGESDACDACLQLDPEASCYRDLPADRLLSQLEAQIRDARAALADEHEGNLRRAALRIFSDAGKLVGLVSSW